MMIFDAQTLWLLGAGMLGSFAHAYVTFSSADMAWNRQHAVETVLGGLGGLLLPNVPLFSGLSPWGQIVIVLVTTYAVPDFAINLTKQLRAKLNIGGP